MSIYSANRSGSMSLSQVSANESYGCNDLGRILYESECNDMAFFEAILASDFREIQGLQEGTILESEIKSLNEASFKNLIASLKERLKKFWAKIKAAFKDVITKIAAYVLRDGKAFVKNFKSIYDKYAGWTGSVDTVRYLIDDAEKYCKIPQPSSVESAIKTMKVNADGINKNEMVKKILCTQKLGEDIEVSEYVKTVLEKSKKDVTVKSGNVNEICDVVSKAGKQIKDLKNAENEAKKNINKMGELLSDAERKSNAEGSDQNAANIVTLVQVYETVITYTTKAHIAIIKADLNNCRRALGEIMSDLRSNGTKKLKEFAILEADEEIENAFEDPDEIDSETQEAIDDIIGGEDDEI